MADPRAFESELREISNMWRAWLIDGYDGGQASGEPQPPYQYAPKSPGTLNIYVAGSTQPLVSESVTISAEAKRLAAGYYDIELLRPGYSTIKRFGVKMPGSFRGAWLEQHRANGRTLVRFFGDIGEHASKPQDVKAEIEIVGIERKRVGRTFYISPVEVAPFDPMVTDFENVPIGPQQVRCYDGAGMLVRQKDFVALTGSYHMVEIQRAWPPLEGKYDRGTHDATYTIVDPKGNLLSNVAVTIHGLMAGGKTWAFACATCQRTGAVTGADGTVTFRNLPASEPDNRTRYAIRAHRPDLGIEVNSGQYQLRDLVLTLPDYGDWLNDVSMWTMTPRIVYPASPHIWVLPPVVPPEEEEPPVIAPELAVGLIIALLVILVIFAL